MSALWQWRELCEALGLPAEDGPDVTGISFDSRRTRPGDLFFALPGDPGPRFNPSYRSDRDGHDFIEAAVAAGAVGAVTHDGGSRNVPQLAVGDTLDALWALGAAARSRLDCPVVAVTGSSGKTTAKGFLAAALDAFATQGSFNNHLGVPVSLALTPRDARAAVYEIGTNHPGEIGPLSRLVRPDVAMVLNVHPAHRENFDSMAELLKEKLSIHEGLPKGGHLVLEETLDASSLPSSVRVSRFGRTAEALVRLVDLKGQQASYLVADEKFTAHVPGGGVHRALSLGAVLCVLELLDRDLEAAAHLPDTLVPAGRGQELTAGQITIIDDSYNANPASMRAALTGLAERPEPRRFALLGEMLELGEESEAFHRELAGAAGVLNGVFCVGSGMRALYDALPGGKGLHWQAEADGELLDRIAGVVRSGDVLLVKGSNRVFWAKDYARRLVTRLSSEKV